MPAITDLLSASTMSCGESMGPPIGLTAKIIFVSSIFFIIFITSLSNFLSKRHLYALITLPSAASISQKAWFIFIK